MKEIIQVAKSDASPRRSVMREVSLILFSCFNTLRTAEIFPFNIDTIKRNKEIMRDKSSHGETLPFTVVGCR